MPAGELCRQMALVPLVGHDGDPLVRSGQGYAIQALTQSGSGPTQDGVWLEPVVAADAPCERPEPDPFAAGERDGPELSGAHSRSVPSERDSARGHLLTVNTEVFAYSQSTALLRPPSAAASRGDAPHHRY